MQNKVEENWSFYPWRDRLKVGLYGTAAIASFYAPLSLVFSAAALGMTAIASSAAATLGFFCVASKISKNEFQEMVKAGIYEPVTEKALLLSFQRLCQKYGLEEETALYKALDSNKYLMDALSLPWHALIDEKYRNFLVNSTASANILTGAVVSTPELLGIKKNNDKTFLTASETEAALAHELGHIKRADFMTPSIRCAITISKPIMLAITVATAAWSALSNPNQFSLSMAADLLQYVGTSVAAVYLCKFASDAFLAAASRTEERRADRNAIYITRNPNALVSFLSKSESLYNCDRSFKQELLASHPSTEPRIKSLKSEWMRITQLPEIKDKQPQKGGFKNYEKSKISL